MDDITENIIKALETDETTINKIYEDVFNEASKIIGKQICETLKKQGITKETEIEKITLVIKNNSLLIYPKRKE